MASFCYRIRSTQKNKLVKIQILFTVATANREENLDFDQFVFLGRANAIAE